MIGFDSLISIVMAVATFFRDNCHPASLFPSWTQYLLPAPTESFSQQSSPVEDLPVIETITMVVTQTAAATASSLNKALAIIPKTAPYAAPTSSDLAREMIYALFTYILRFFTHPLTLLLFFSFGFELLKVIVIYRIASSSVPKQQDTIKLEAQIIERDGTIEKMRSAHATTVAELREKLYTQEEKARTAHFVHRVEMGKKVQEIKTLGHKLEWSGHMEIKARYDSDDKVRDLEKKIDQLRLVVDTLEDKLEAAGELIDAAEQADDKANKEKIVRERQNAQAHIDKLRTEIETQKNNVRIEEYKVQELKRENKELGAKAREAAAVPNLPSFVGKTTATAAEETRRRLQALPGPESPRSPAPTPAIVAPSSSTAFGPRANPITTPAVRQTKGPRPRPTVWIAAALPNPIRLARPPPPPIMPKTKNSRGK
ncbi:hypothetical protein M438DRAFT_263130 [Aureobasidium pullulans EXF-150]|uniref:Uncharacterized protein n=1 Tax=Aureobasidium pullulans EXF-150 TaxID=1043002 RepID=A0A074Y5G9_AURPU|nr:uncharacterized protein M438DRAFT_263130 [Aureobasidium pullulans EXF-150]KEQ89447.1 hypothetical protein M438DRAFT_263130 [Aureobasidium pullulans EXF-150]